LDRLKQRNPELSDKECQQRVDSQMPLEQKLQLADIVIWNTEDDSNSNSNSNNSKTQKKTKNATDSSDSGDTLISSPKLEQQIEKVRRQLTERVYGVMETSFAQFLLFFGAFIVISVSVRYYFGMMG
jgi:dephospho-CoA kinase